MKARHLLPDNGQHWGLTSRLLIYWLTKRKRKKTSRADCSVYKVVQLVRR